MRRRDLRHADAEDLAAGADGAGADADEDAGDAGLHELARGARSRRCCRRRRVSDRAAARASESIRPSLAVGDVARAGDGRLDDENINAASLATGANFLVLAGVAETARDAAEPFTLATSFADELGPYRRSVRSLHDCRRTRRSMQRRSLRERPPHRRSACARLRD